MNRDFKGIWIPREIWLREDLSALEKTLWAEIHSLFDRESGGCYASNEYLATFCGVQDRRLREMISNLKSKGLVEQVSFNGRVRVIKAIVPDEDFSPCQADRQKSASLTGGKVPVSPAEKCHPHIYRDTSIEKSIDKTPPTPQSGGSANAELGGNSFSSSSADIEQKQTPRQKGTNPRAKETNPRSESTNPRTQDAKTPYRPHVLLTEDEHYKLKSQYGEEKLNTMLDILDAYKGSSGKRYKSDYYTLLPHGWVHQRFLEGKDAKTPVVAKHRQGSKLAFETEKDTWKPPERKPKELTQEEKDAYFKEFGVRL